MRVVQYFGMVALMNSPTMLLKFAGIKNDSRRSIRLECNWRLTNPRKSRKSLIALEMCLIVQPYGMSAFWLNPLGLSGCGAQASNSGSDFFILRIHAKRGGP